MAAPNPSHEWRRSSYSQPAGDNCVECASASWITSSYSGAHGENCVECASASWTTSSYSNGNGGECVECASASWTTSSYSTNGGECLEYAPLSTSVAVRDSKHPDRGHLDFSGVDWSAFLGAVKGGTLDA